MTCGGMLEALGILFEEQDFPARTPEKGIAAMDGDTIPICLYFTRNAAALLHAE